MIEANHIPLSLYVHFPWCVRKCPYCDFNSHAVGEAYDEAVYVDALLSDLEKDGGASPDRAIRSVFIGGGTPSLLSGEAIARLLEGIRSRVSLAENVEITLEANPGAVDSGHFAGYREAGVTRLSIGAQSFDDGKLVSLGRIHSGREITQAMETARRAGFPEINLDIMYALPGQTPAQAIADLDKAIALQPSHLSWYQLTIEPNTAFHHSPPPDLPDEETTWTIHEAGRTRLAEAGYPQYEVSAYAAAPHHCRHNRNYWEFGDYLGIGAGAHGKITHADGTVERRRKPRHPVEYMADVGSESATGTTILQDEDLVLEFMMNALRLNGGVPVDWFSERTGLSFSAVLPRLRILESRGLVAPAQRHIVATETGRRYLNELLLVFT